MIDVDKGLTKDRNLNTFKMYCKRRKSGARFPDGKARNRLYACHCIPGNGPLSFPSDIMWRICFEFTAIWAYHTSSQGRSYRGFGGSDEPPTGWKRSAKIDLFFFFFFFFLSGIAQESVFVEKDERTPPAVNRHARRGMARFEWHLAQTPPPPKKTSRRPTCKTRRGQMRMPNAVLLFGICIVPQ